MTGTLDELVKEAGEALAYDGETRKLGVYGVADGKLLNELHKRMHSSSSLDKLLCESHYFYTVGTEAAETLEELGFRIEVADIIRIFYGVQTQKTLSMCVQSVLGSKRSMADEVPYEYVQENAGELPIKRVKVADHRVSKGIQTRGQLLDLLTLLEAGGTVVHGAQFRRAMVGVSTVFARLMHQTSSNSSVVKASVDELWKSYCWGIRCCMQQAVAADTHCGRYFGTHFKVLRESFNTVVVPKMIHNAHARDLVSSKRRGEDLRQQMDELRRDLAEEKAKRARWMTEEDFEEDEDREEEDREEDEHEEDDNGEDENEEDVNEADIEEYAREISAPHLLNAMGDDALWGSFLQDPKGYLWEEFMESYCWTYSPQEYRQARREVLQARGEQGEEDEDDDEEEEDVEAAEDVEGGVEEDVEEAAEVDSERYPLRNRQR